MAEKCNFLLGRGERLTEPVTPSGRKVVKYAPYTVEQARARLKPMLERTVTSFDALDIALCPADETVASIVLNPEYLAKSYFPKHLLKTFDLRAVGSRSRKVLPDQKSQERPPEEKLSTELFVAGKRASFRRFSRSLGAETQNRPVDEELAVLEIVTAIASDDKIKSSPARKKDKAIEIVLHAGESRSEGYIIDGFRKYAETFDLEVNLDKRIHAGGLCFLRMYADGDSIKKLARYSFLRAVRVMPSLRASNPVTRRASISTKLRLPIAGAVDTGIRVAIFDGGLPPNTPFAPWVNRYDGPNLGKATPEFLEHGNAVTSAALFGHIESGATLKQPFASIDHYRVFDEASEDPFHLPEAAERIRSILQTSARYDFINLSIGPQTPLDDDDIDSWTAVLDDALSEGKTLATVAVGNDGDANATERLNRIQPPSDCVNALAVGACDRHGASWARAAYSSVGPGRSPGLVKPAVVGFGGCDAEPYGILGNSGVLTSDQGTSFAAPHVMRLGVGAKAVIGKSLRPLAIHALLVHAAKHNNLPQSEIGWGRVPENIEEIVTCPPGVVRVIYQGDLTSSKYIRARIPTPGPLKGTVTLEATCCFATAVDTAHASLYTRSGLEFIFRPHNKNFATNESIHPKTSTFFSKKTVLNYENELRADAHKWETCLHASKRMRGTSLNDPCFDIHYLSRDEGQSDSVTQKIQYALVITIEAPKHLDIYDEIVRAYRTVLEPLRPQTQIPLTIS